MIDDKKDLEKVNDDNEKRMKETESNKNVFIFIQQDISNADKASTSSERSCRTHSEDADTSSLSSLHKRSIFSGRLPFHSTNQHPNMTTNIPEVDDQHLSNENLSSTVGTKDCDSGEYQTKTDVITKSSLDVVTSSSAGTVEISNSNNKSKIAALRQNFFSQQQITNISNSKMPNTQLSSSTSSVSSKEQK